MKKKIVSIVKYNRFILWMYRFCGNILVSFLRIFIKVDQKKILFMSFGGQKYDDSPKALYETIIKDNYFKSYKIVWAFINPNSINIPVGKKVKIDTYKFYKEVLSSKYWINNSSVERGLKFRRKETFEINTWHGTPLKKMGCDILNYKGYSAKAKPKVGKTIYCSQSDFDQKIFTRLFITTKENIIISDLPRNDFLTNYTKQNIDNVKAKLNIEAGKKVILYAPTFREYDRDFKSACFIRPPVDFDKWERMLGSDFVLLFRAHYEVINVLGIKTNSFVIDVSNYPSLNELMIISDMLVSDYSSIYFDYAILEKPMLNFSYDLEEYKKRRGVYKESFNALPCRINKTEKELLDDINNINYKERIDATKRFKEKFCPNAGKSCQIVVSKLKEYIENNE